MKIQRLLGGKYECSGSISEAQLELKNGLVIPVILGGFGETASEAIDKCFNKIKRYLGLEHFECLDCEDTGEVDNYIFDQDSKNWILDGTKKCVCQLPIED
jgi:hypothetical protein